MTDKTFPPRVGQDEGQRAHEQDSGATRSCPAIPLASQPTTETLPNSDE